jgi:hypothetical protein
MEVPMTRSRAGKKPEPVQPFSDESEKADETRPRVENERIRRDEATQQDEKADLVDDAHKLAR